MIVRAAPPNPRIFPHVSRCLFVLAFTTIMCSASDEGAACWPKEAYAQSSDDPEDSGCVPEPAGQACDPSTQRCESVCEPSEYLLVCRTKVSTAGTPVATLRASYSPSPKGAVVPTPGSGLNCGPLRVPVAAVPNQAMYCCRCAG